ncbi:hypothetical protein B0O80DRAFT_493369 [Mortierella sp. GBAus27b]|nr:hypothetical protein B0O80DRAFT_493369 [Mortierella sp. GBAus27b]
MIPIVQRKSRAYVVFAKPRDQGGSRHSSTAAEILVTAIHDLNAPHSIQPQQTQECTSPRYFRLGKTKPDTNALDCLAVGVKSTTGCRHLNPAPGRWINTGLKAMSCQSWHDLAANSWIQITQVFLRVMEDAGQMRLGSPPTLANPTECAPIQGGILLNHPKLHLLRVGYRIRGNASVADNGQECSWTP